MPEGRTDLHAQIASLRALAHGWLDGHGEAIDPAGCDRVERILARAIAAHGLPLPFLYPTEEGRIHAEWGIGPWSVSADFDLDARTVYCHALDVKAPIETAAEREQDWAEALDPDGEALALFVAGCQ